MESGNTLNVDIYIDNEQDPVVRMQIMDLLKHKHSVIYDVISSLNICDGCSAPVSIIITEEDRITVNTVMMSIMSQKRGFTIIQGKQA